MGSAGNAEARFGDDPLSEQIQPRQVAEWGLRQRQLLRKSKGKDASAAPRALAVISSAMSIIFVWVFAPLVIFFFWWRSMPTHMGLLTFWLGGLLLLACWVDWRSWGRKPCVCSRARSPCRRSSRPCLSSKPLELPCRSGIVGDSHGKRILGHELGKGCCMGGKPDRQADSRLSSRQNQQDFSCRKQNCAKQRLLNSQRIGSIVPRRNGNTGPNGASARTCRSATTLMQ